MTRPVVYDLTRLASRFVNATPNGIDRVDAAFARRFLSAATTQGLLLHPWGPRVIDRNAGAQVVETITQRWRDDRAHDDTALTKIAAWLRAPEATSAGVKRLEADRPRATRRALIPLSRAVFGFGSAPATAISKNAVYLNVSQFPLWNSAYFRWTHARPDVRIVPFIHDLLPLQHPEFFRGGEAARHRKRLQLVASRAAAAIVTTDATRDALSAFVAAEGRTDLPIHVAHLPVDPRFAETLSPDTRLCDAPPFFVMCGTIEPRKNHLLVLSVWCDLVRRHGTEAPRLIFVGRRGWKNAAILDRLAHDATLSRHVLEISDLDTSSLCRLLDAAHGAFVPSFAEGFGLPVAETCAIGTPLIASDIPVFREIAGDAALYLDPHDTAGWAQAIMNLATMPRDATKTRRLGATWQEYFAGVEDFLSELPVRSSQNLRLSSRADRS